MRPFLNKVIFSIITRRNASKTTNIHSYDLALFGDLQCCLPAWFHIEVSPLYAYVVSKVHPFGQVFFEVWPHWLSRGPALQNRDTHEKN